MFQNQTIVLLILHVANLGRFKKQFEYVNEQKRWFDCDKNIGRLNFWCELSIT